MANLSKIPTDSLPPFPNATRVQSLVDACPETGAMLVAWRHKGKRVSVMVSTEESIGRRMSEWLTDLNAPSQRPLRERIRREVKRQLAKQAPSK